MRNAPNDNSEPININVVVLLIVLLFNDEQK